MIDDKQTQIVNKLSELLDGAESWKTTGENSMMHLPTGLRIGHGEEWVCIYEGVDHLKISKEDALLLVPKIKLVRDDRSYTEGIRDNVLERINKEVPDVRNDSTITASK